MFHENQQIGNYTLIRKLGRGGFGEVWLANDEDEYFAVKLPHKDQVDWKQITQEIGLWTLCGKHPNLMPLVGARNFNGQIAIISEYTPDGSLEDLLKEKGKLSEIEAVEMTIGILEGLQHLHESGIIHRDLKPANILLDGKTPRLTDFGISRIISADSLSETIAGTWAYMAPECFDGKRNVQTDIWAVGVIFYRMLTGNLPFPQKEQTALVGSIIMREPEPLADEISLATKELVSNILSKNPSERLSSHLIKFDLENYIDVHLNQQKILIAEAKARLAAKRGLQVENIQSTQLIPYRKRNKWGFCDAEKNILIEPKYDSARKFREGLALISDGGRYGFIDKLEKKIELFPHPKQPSLIAENGNEIITPEYETIDDFSCGLARVRLDESWRFINKSGEELICLNSECKVQSFIDGLALVEWKNRYGFINTEGQIAIPIIYERIADYYNKVRLQEYFFAMI